MARGPRGPNRSTLRKRIEALSETYEPRMRRAFLEAIEDVVSRAELGRIIEALERGDIEAAIRAMHLDPAAFRLLETTKAEAFEAGGRATVDSMPVLRSLAGDRIVIRFDVRNPRAEAYLSGRSGSLISNAGGLSDRLFAEQVSSLRTAMTNGLQAGRNPRSVALDMIGRMDRATGRRVGGSIGLSNPQQAAVERARAALLSGDKKAMKQYLTLQRRDRRFDAMVNRAIADGKAVSPDMVDRAIGRYSDRLLQLRGETIARTEIQGALAKSKDEAFRQAVDSGGVTENQVKKVWMATNDARKRDNHWAMNGMRVGLNEVFPNGLLHPHAEGAPPEEVINCRCTYEHVIDFLADLD